jgi:uncharacterized protein YydD (DUF2326 family)
MKLSRLYTNKPGVFLPIDFLPGFNVILGEIRLRENRTKDTHNLGKSTVGRLIDFAMLSKRDPEFFLFKHINLFNDIVFFLEIQLLSGSYLTVRRSVSAHSKIAFKKHERPRQDFTSLADNNWDHLDVPLDSARELLDSLLDWRDFKPWPYRKGLGYLLRAQEDYRDVFQLRQFQQGRHVDWKPFVAHILGFNGELVKSHYEREADLKLMQSQEQTIKAELPGSIEDISKIEGLLLLKQMEAERKQGLIDAFNLDAQEREWNARVVDELDGRISQLNSRRYTLTHARKLILSSLEEGEIAFRPDQAEELFREANVLFSDQLKRDFEQLLAFNRAITQERGVYLRKDLAETEAELTEVNAELSKLNAERAQMLSLLRDADVFARFREASDELVTLRADIIGLERQREQLRRLQELRAEIRKLSDECRKIQEEIEVDLEQRNADRNSLFSKIRLYFNDVVERVVDRKALLSVAPNKEGHLEFRAEVLDSAGNATSADLGHTYRKLLCVAFDLALLHAHMPTSYPRFAYHDGVLESLDDRKKENLLAVLRSYSDLDLQIIITLIDSDLPPRPQNKPAFTPEEIILILHDEGESGRLFRMRAW